MEDFDPSLFSHYAIDYGDIRILQSKIQHLTVQNSEISHLLTGSETGAGVRILRGGNWGFSSTTDISSSGTAKVIQQAFECLSSGNQVHMAKVKPYTQKITASSPTVMDTGLIEQAQESESALHCSPHVKRGRVDVRYQDTVKHFYSTDGSCIGQKLILIIIDFHTTARKNGKVSESHYSHAFTSMESLKKAELVRRASETAQEALNGLDAGPSPNGEFPVILGPSLASIFIHEAVGHRMEADEVMKPRALLRGKEGNLITHPSLTVIDTMNDAENWYQFDDEGVPKKETTLIDRGRVKRFLHDRETAHHFDTESTGNSRASSYETKPLIRMTNIKVLEGDMSFEEMREECSRGVVLDGFLGGAALPDGTFRFVASGGHLIEGGAVTSPVGRSVISSSTLDALSCVLGVGKKVVMHYSGCMKKGQELTVGLGSPELLISRLRVGG